ncbi:hypothetical protein MGYG_01463 [Nannizzia gypsea CBS 118893]|uniref:C3HC zinc finger domain-containing protein n=1 Tax=Arthroderma gypseum (strain ATCC MYA-4604 / CBS 118893) TaxID=535722 RepID=E5R0Z1_ARTGP|nr:hypothetical protein MGYG_01463 [Nannizzia gypsea CBS 118893]EFQ98433.1 hypothetical protein MGYG_01463 [Nannizzia gypsea CBS 118893]
MSYAVTSKKRKFHRVLDSISLGASQKSTSPQASPAGNKLMLGETTQINPSIKRVRLSGGNDSEDSPVIPSGKAISRHSTPSTTSLRPSFVPWDRERFLERLETFRNVERWKPQPDAINEVQWAKRGWSCADKNRVECIGGCGRSVVVKLPDDIDELEEYDSEKVADRRDVRAQLVVKYQNLIVEGHAEKCPWRKSACDDSIQRLPLTNAETALQNLQSRYENLLSARIKFPPMNTLILPEKFDIESMLASLPPGILDKSSAETHESENTAPSGELTDGTEKELLTANKTAFALAFFGWDISGEASAGLAGCKACFRRLGLWMYVPKEDGSPPLYSELSIVGEHLDYCPWVNPESQSGKKSGQCGWEALGRVVESEHRRHTWSKNKPLQAEQASLSQTEHIAEQVDEETRRTKDREWWAKLRRVRQILQPKGTKR